MGNGAETIVAAAETGNEWKNVPMGHSLLRRPFRPPRLFFMATVQGMPVGFGSPNKAGI